MLVQNEVYSLYTGMQNTCANISGKLGLVFEEM